MRTILSILLAGVILTMTMMVWAECKCSITQTKSQNEVIKKAQKNVTIELTQEQMAIIQKTYPELTYKLSRQLTIPDPKKYADIDTMMCIEVDAKGIPVLPPDL